MDDAALRLVGLGVRAGGVVLGTGAVRAELQRGRARVVILAADPSPRTREKVERLAHGKGVPVVAGPEADTLGARLGRGRLQAVAIVDRQLAEGFMTKVAGSPVGGTRGN